MRHVKYACLTALAVLAASQASAEETGGYAVTGTISGPDGGWDYTSVDPLTRQVYVSRAHSVTVADPASGTVRPIGTIAKAHASVPIPDLKLLLVTSGGDDSVRLLDPQTGLEKARIAVGSDPDAAFYDDRAHRAVVMNAEAGTVSVIDVATARVTSTIALQPGLEFGALGEGTTLFVNNEDRDEVETADLNTGKAGDAIALPGCKSPSGLAYDARTRVLISACANGKAAIVDATSRKVVKLLDIGMGPDAVILDAERRLAFIPCGRDGTLSEIALDGDGGPKVIATIATQVGARTGAVDPQSGTLYLPTAEFTPATTFGGRPMLTPGTFRIVVVTRQAR